MGEYDTSTRLMVGYLFTAGFKRCVFLYTVCIQFRNFFFFFFLHVQEILSSVCEQM